ncbi:eukaryotic cytochrome b561-domain-containing protein [Jimgerdemannia flammicorona]|uniref:Eukaryotic cytochrome b561-domain-containing protein n=2 Tax=Jimgerdemannia flammicorona TaxID=994334 RepID=A0A433QD76_9FUNG|nr:eukaryotic cytochrome b561-domain-containing protein [Jimgerdemannia flammicorona]RUS27756.1 eukaryotic cytochrome b561-domain-containing protein [Jimgerdemannia flammicorona]
MSSPKTTVTRPRSSSDTSHTSHTSDTQRPLLSDPPTPTLVVLHNDEPQLVGTVKPIHILRRLADIMSLFAQLGLVIFVVSVYTAIIKAGWPSPFAWHPALMTILLVAVTEGILILQPTTTPAEKATGLNLHKWTLIIGYTCAIGGSSVIFYNKVLSGKEHFTTTHSQLGAFTSSYLLIQLLFGLSMVYLPNLFGGVGKAKALWKYHRLSGYFLFIFVWVTAQFGAHSDWYGPCI